MDTIIGSFVIQYICMEGKIKNFIFGVTFSVFPVLTICKTNERNEMLYAFFHEKTAYRKGILPNEDK